MNNNLLIIFNAWYMDIWSWFETTFGSYALLALIVGIILAFCLSCLLIKAIIKTVIKGFFKLIYILIWR